MPVALHDAVVKAWREHCRAIWGECSNISIVKTVLEKRFGGFGMYIFAYLEANESRFAPSLKVTRFVLFVSEV